MAGADRLVQAVFRVWSAVYDRPVFQRTFYRRVHAALASLLDDYNNGEIGPGHCGTVPAAPTTWGSLKSTYRH